MTTPVTTPPGALVRGRRTSEADTTDLIAAAVSVVPGVAGLHGGVFGEVASYLPGRRVTGVRARGDAVTEIHVAVYYGASIRETVAQVRLAAAGIVGGIIDVTVEDVIPMVFPMVLDVDDARVPDSSRTNPPLNWLTYTEPQHFSEDLT